MTKRLTKISKTGRKELVPRELDSIFNVDSDTKINYIGVKNFVLIGEFIS